MYGGSFLDIRRGFRMTELLTAAQMRAIEKAAIASGAVTGLELMERAGQGVVKAIFEEWPHLTKTSHHAAVLCGPGNNGGDGFVVARLLKERGWEVEVFLYGDPQKLPPDAKANYERWVECGVVRQWDYSTIIACEVDIYIDAVFGVGLNREPSDEVMKVFTELYISGKSYEKMVSVDIPTGLSADSGKDICLKWGAVYTFLTVTFHRMKLGHLLDEGAQFCGKTVVHDIGLPDAHNDNSKVTTLVQPCVYDLQKREDGHKYSHGHAFILLGGPGQGGAARLAARAALRVGAGAVTVGCSAAALTETAARLDAIMIRLVENALGLREVLQDERINALCIGPGLGLNEREADLVSAVLQSGRKVVLDADALTLLARDKALFDQLHENCVLTPHAGEFARLFPDIAEKLSSPTCEGQAYSKVDATREAAARSGCVVLFKGADTVISDPFGASAINAAFYDRAAPWLATAGSGDVLAGFITGLLARGFESMEAAETAAWLHVECARSFGPGLVAEDLPEELPNIFRGLGL